jgi:Putative zincin peptidase
VEERLGMLEKIPLNPTNVDLASGEMVYVFGLGRAVALRLASYSMVLAFLAAGVFSALIGGSNLGIRSIHWVQPVLYLVVYFGVVVVHELIHGLFFRIFGGNPQYGAGFKYFLPYFYATSPGNAFSVRQMIIIALAPFLTISTSSLLLAPLFPSLVSYFAVAFIGNTAGAVGDLWMTSRLIRFLPIKDAEVFDLADSMTIHSREVRAGKIAKILSARDKQPSGFIEHWIGATLVLFAVGMLAGAIVPIFIDNLLIGPPQLPLMAFKRTSQGVTWTFNLFSPLLAGFIFAIAAHLFSPRKSRGAESRIFK